MMMNVVKFVRKIRMTMTKIGMIVVFVEDLGKVDEIMTL